jgi:Domain of unknown function (DUF4184)
VPFTGSHPAAALPFLRTPLPASALVIGSLAPDIPFYLPRFAARRTHTALGVATVDTALAAAGWAVWHGLLAGPALGTAPAPFRARLTSARPGLRRRLRGPRAAARVVAGLVTGAATHVLWDEFTHADRWGTAHVPALAAEWRGRPVHVWAQDASGVVGAAALAAWFARWWRRTPADPAVGRGGSPWAWAAVAAAGLAGAAAGAAGRADPRTAAEIAAFRGGAAGTVAAAALALAWHARNATDPAR